MFGPVYLFEKAVPSLQVRGHTLFPLPPSTEKQQEEKMMGRDVYRVDVCLEDALSSAELMMNSVLVGRPR